MVSVIAGLSQKCSTNRLNKVPTKQLVAKWVSFKEYIMAVKQFSINQISSEADRKKLLDAMKECSNSMIRMEGEKDFIKKQSKKFVKT